MLNGRWDFTFILLGLSGFLLVGGPVLPDFDDDMKRGLRRHPAFRPAYDESGPVPVIYGCGNCLITRPVFGRLGSAQHQLQPIRRCNLVIVDHQ